MLQWSLLTTCEPPVHPPSHHHPATHPLIHPSIHTLNRPYQPPSLCQAQCWCQEHKDVSGSICKGFLGQWEIQTYTQDTNKSEITPVLGEARGPQRYRQQGEIRCLTTLFTEEQSMAEALLPFGATAHVHHISCYTLTYNPSTRVKEGYWKGRGRGGWGDGKRRKLMLTQYIREHSLIDM